MGRRPSREVSETDQAWAPDECLASGGHFRDDYPSRDVAEGKVNIVTLKGPDGSMQIRREQIPEIPDHLKSVISEMK